MIERKTILKFMTCGSVDDGKSTLLGKLLFDSNNIFEDQKSELFKKNKIDYSLLLDGLSSEREQGVTIDVAYRYFNTSKRKFIILDTPGHLEYTRNMVNAASLVDLSIILIDAKKGISHQTKRHTYLCSLLGVDCFVLAVNKMDLINYSEKKYKDILNDFKIFSKNLKIKKTYCIPISALKGDNVVSKSYNMRWYKGKSLFNFLNNYKVLENINVENKFIMPVQLVSKNKYNNRIYSGRIINGNISKNKKIKVLPSNTTTKILKVITANKKISGYKWESIRLKFTNEVDCSRGDLICSYNLEINTSDQFNVTLIWMDKEELIKGRSYWLKIGTKVTHARIQTIINKTDVENFNKLAAKKIKLNDISECILITDENIPYFPYSKSKELGSFILIDKQTNNTIAAGLINFALSRSENIYEQETTVIQKHRSKIKGHKPITVWLTGISASGKSTIADIVEKKLNLKNYHTYILDGDNIRLGLNKDLGFTKSDRVENIRRVSEIAKLMNDAGLIVIVAFISPFQNERLVAKKLIGNKRYIEVFIDTPIDVAIKRDPKGLYKKVKAGKIKNFTGYDSPYEKPLSPDIHIKTNQITAEEAADSIINYLFKKI